MHPDCQLNLNLQEKAIWSFVVPHVILALCLLIYLTLSWLPEKIEVYRDKDEKLVPLNCFTGCLTRTVKAKWFVIRVVKANCCCCVKGGNEHISRDHSENEDSRLLSWIADVRAGLKDKGQKAANVGVAVVFFAYQIWIQV